MFLPFMVNISTALAQTYSRNNEITLNFRARRMLQDSISNDNKVRKPIDDLEDKLNQSRAENMQHGIQRLRAKDVYFELMKLGDKKSLRHANALDREYFITDESYEIQKREIIRRSISNKTGKQDSEITYFDTFKYRLQRDKKLEVIVNLIPSYLILTGAIVYALIQ